MSGGGAGVAAAGRAVIALLALHAFVAAQDGAAATPDAQEAEVQEAGTAVSLQAVVLEDAPVHLLAGHLVVLLPAGAVIEARAHNIMDAPAADALETRAVLDVGTRRVVLMAHELARSAPEDLPAAVRALFEDDAERREALVVHENAAGPGGARVVRVEPPAVDATREAILVAGAVVAHPDGTLQSVAVYVNAATLDDLAGARDLAARVLGTLQPGPRSLTRKPGTIELATDAGRHLLIDVPGDVLYGRQVGVDFLVHRLRVIVPLGRDGHSLGIYEGWYPQEPAESAVREKATLCGREVSWELTQDVVDGGTTYSAEVVMRHPLAEESPVPEVSPESGEGGLLPPPPEEEFASLHVFIHAVTVEERARLMQLAGTLRVVDTGGSGR